MLGMEIPEVHIDVGRAAVMPRFLEQGWAECMTSARSISRL